MMRIKSGEEVLHELPKIIVAVILVRFGVAVLVGIWHAVFAH